MELLPNWLCWGCKASAFYHHTRTRLGRGRGGYVHVRFFQYSSGSIKSHFINHSTFLHTRFSKMYEDVIICLNFFLIFHEKYPKKDLFHRFHAVNKHFETQIWVWVSFKSPKAKGYLIKRLGKWYQGDSSELFPSTAEVFIERKGGLFFFKSLCKVSRNHLVVWKSSKPFYEWLNFPTSQWNIPMYILLPLRFSPTTTKTMMSQMLVIGLSHHLSLSSRTRIKCIMLFWEADASGGRG